MSDTFITIWRDELQIIFLESSQGVWNQIKPNWKNLSSSESGNTKQIKNNTWTSSFNVLLRDNSSHNKGVKISKVWRRESRWQMKMGHQNLILGIDQNGTWTDAGSVLGDLQPQIFVLQIDKGNSWKDPLRWTLERRIWKKFLINAMSEPYWGTLR